MKKVIIVGATSGIGREMALEFVKRGWKVGAAGRRVNLLESLKNETDGMVDILSLDITDEKAADKLNGFIDKLGGIDLIFLVSGVGKQNPDLDFDIERYTIETNVMGFTRIVDTAFDYFKKSGKPGHIAVVSSIAGTKGLGVAASYSATKRYQNTYIDALEQLAYIKNLPIKFTDIRPGFVKTDLLADSKTYPMLLDPVKVARSIVTKTLKKKRVVVIDWRYAIMVFGWSLIPRCIWRRMKVTN